MKRLIRRMLHGFRREDGTATVEFALMVPVLMALFMMSFESGLYMTRSIMLHQAVDQTMRVLSQGRLTDTSPEGLKESICSRTVIIRDCEDVMTIDMRTVDTSTWIMPPNVTECRDRGADVDPLVSFDQGTANEVVLVRVCVVVDPIFPTTGIAANMSEAERDSEGGYALTASAAFTNEP